MNTMKIFLIIFAAISVSHVIFIFLEKEKLRRLTKILIIPPLLAAYIAGMGFRPFLPISALILGWIGDILLIRIDKKTFFQLGLGSFLLGHLCYIIAFIGLLGFFGSGSAAGTVNIPAILIFTLPSVFLGMVVFRLIKPTKEMYLPVILYMTILVAMSFLGFQVFLFNPGIAGLLILSGCFNFMVSDTILAYYTFRKPKILGSILIMAYYIIAQAEIIIGIMMLVRGLL